VGDRQDATSWLDDVDADVSVREISTRDSPSSSDKWEHSTPLSGARLRSATVMGSLHVAIESALLVQCGAVRVKDLGTPVEKGPTVDEAARRPCKPGASEWPDSEVTRSK